MSRAWPVWPWVEALTGFACLWRARWRRRQGRYDRTTLGLYWQASRLHPRDAARRLAWLGFRRDLGLPLPRRWTLTLERTADELTGAQRRQAETLLGDRSGSGSAMAALRQDFSDWIRLVHATGPVCVAGNAAGLTGRSLGSAIDAHAAVVRFNRWQVGEEGGPDDDVGQCCAVWVVAAACPAPAPAGAHWAVVSGPDPAARMEGWQCMRSIRQSRLPALTVPLPIWRQLVRELQAPPSAGLLMLAWLHHLLGGWAGLSAAGIGWGRSPAGRQHVLLTNRQTGSRHAWDREAALVAGFVRAGLHDLGSEQRPSERGLAPHGSA